MKGGRRRGRGGRAEEGGAAGAPPPSGPAGCAARRQRRRRAHGESSRPPGSAPALAPAPARARPAQFQLGPCAHLPGKWHPSPLPPRPATRPHPPPPPPLRRASRLCLCPRSSGSGCGCDSRARLSGSADCAARLRAQSMGRLGSARSAPGVKLHSSLGSEENLLKPGVAQGGDGGAGDGTGSSFLRPSGFLSDAGPVGAHRLGKGLVALWPPNRRRGWGRPYGHPRGQSLVL